MWAVEWLTENITDPHNNCNEMTRYIADYTQPDLLPIWSYTWQSEERRFYLSTTVIRNLRTHNRKNHNRTALQKRNTQCNSGTTQNHLPIPLDWNDVYSNSYLQQVHKYHSVLLRGLPERNQRYTKGCIGRSTQILRNCFGVSKNMLRCWESARDNELLTGIRR